MNEHAAAAKLFGRLLVREIDAALLAELSQPDVDAALLELGVVVPKAPDLDVLATEWFEAFLHPRDSAPPVQSLWIHGQYDGASRVAVSAIAAAAQRELATGARGAPPDHLGCILILWADLIVDAPTLADRLARDHMEWAPTALRSTCERGGFYGTIARACTDFVVMITDTTRGDVDRSLAAGGEVG